ncbi:MAG TPA: oligoribonuclease [Patescibacteria group bacterium]
MSSANPLSPLVWVDLEMTDLDPVNGRIVEIATIITTNDLVVVAEGPDLVIHQPESVLKSMSSWCKEHFGDSGLTQEIRESKISLKEAEEKTLAFLKKHCLPQSALLAGSSVYVDREFMSVQMPSIIDFLHYRIIDVNTIKELSHRWYPGTPDYPKVEPHRAKNDVYEAIDELKYYRKNLFKPKYK